MKYKVSKNIVEAPRIQFHSVTPRTKLPKMSDLERYICMSNFISKVETILLPHFKFSMALPKKLKIFFYKQQRPKAIF